MAGLAALAAFELARERGLANVRVPEIARAAGVSTRTFNNYFASKERAIAWLAGRHAAEMASALQGRPADEPLGRCPEVKPGKATSATASHLDDRETQVSAPSTAGASLGCVLPRCA